MPVDKSKEIGRGIYNFIFCGNAFRIMWFVIHNSLVYGRRHKKAVSV